MKIAVITSHYPVPKNNIYTYADHYLVKEWIDDGHTVQVFFLLSNYALKTGFHICSKQYEIEGIRVNYISYPRFIPKSPFVTLGIAKKVEKMVSDKLQASDFIPDLFYCDFCSANWRIIELMRKESRFCKSSFVPVFNNCDFNSKGIAKRIVNSSEIIGVRSNAQKERVIEIRKNAQVFVALSGIPNDVVENTKLYKPSSIGNLINVLYVGDLIPLKNVDILLKAICELSKKWNIQLRIIGSGPEKEKLSMYTKRNKMTDKVIFTGRIPREEVLTNMEKSDLFVMVSKPESFGMVYVEAMSKGCFVIGSKGEGIDGVIIDGENGALVNPRDVDALVKCIERFLVLPKEEQLRIRENAIQTAFGMTEKRVAQKVLEDIRHIQKNKENRR